VGAGDGAGGEGERMSSVRVVVGDDHPVYRDGVVRALELDSRTTVVAAVGDGQAALEAIREHLPEVALLDYRMPGLDGVAIAHAVLRDKLPTRVLLLSATTEGQVVYRAIQDGAAGYLSKEADRDEIVAAVVACARGENVLPPELVASLTTQVRQHAQSQAPSLSERERQILRMIADGKSVPEMAAELFLAQTTVKTHIRRLYEKLDVSDRGAAVAKAMRSQLLE
jgi:two-component system, NarL family, nitrate/nitrite response regulator NarL